MKHYIFVSLAVLTFIVATPRAHALFGHVAAEKTAASPPNNSSPKRSRLCQTNQHLQTTIHVLAAGVTVALITGAAIGSKTRRDA